MVDNLRGRQKKIQAAISISYEKISYNERVINEFKNDCQAVVHCIKD